MTTRSGRGSPFVRRLEGELRSRLSEIDREARGLRAALAALEGSPPRRRRQSQEDLRRVILAAVTETPGSRASVLALGSGWEVDDVRAALLELEHAGLVERDGLGWRRAEMDAAGSRSTAG